MKDKGSLHSKVQELCDCFAATDPLREMSVVKDDADKQEAALKWLALAALHGVNNNAEKISIVTTDQGKVKVTAKYRKTDLPSPGLEIAEKIIEAVKNITHMEESAGKILLALGLRDSSIDLGIEMKTKAGGKKLTITFPEC
ncbi:MAG: hypothetical protein Q8P24_20385 [Desulfobacterales bacterium]|nr:hypothetical protein [Desulfobacterales bacterium]